MRTQLALVSSLLGCVLAACGGDDGGSTTPDMAIVVDAAPDAPTAAQGLGKVCAAPADCPTSAPICAKLSSAAATGFCTLTCGTTAVPPMGMTPMPPPTGNAMCTASMPQPPSGTVGCVLSAAPMNNMITWACGIGCGTVQNTNLGNCPTGLTCTSNICQ